MTQYSHQVSINRLKLTEDEEKRIEALGKNHQKTKEQIRDDVLLAIEAMTEPVVLLPKHIPEDHPKHWKRSLFP